MNASTVSEIRQEQGFEVYALGNQDVEIATVPEVGAKIISLKDRRTGREWMWHPAGKLELFRNSAGDDFSISTLVGWDECLPTIAPCAWRGRALPDHGEVWAVPWRVDADAWAKGILKTSVGLAVSPFEFTRTIELRGNELRLHYQLGNRSPEAEQFLWAMHPLLELRAGDRLELPESTRSLLRDHAWIDAVDSAVPAGGCAKIFAAPVSEGRAGVHNSNTGDRIQFEWNPAENNTLGIWLTRGGWNGHHHFALEPTNGAPDPLTEAAARNHCDMVPANGLVTWSVVIRIGA